MLRKIIIAAVIVLVPLAFFLASTFVNIETVTFKEAMNVSSEEQEGDKAPKVVIVTSLTQMGQGIMVGEDREGTAFRVDYTGSPPDVPFAPGQTVRFVGHVHGGEEPYFHATQVYGE